MTYFGTRLSDHLSRRDPEGYLICLEVPVARTGIQEYLPEELGLEPGGLPVPVFRPEEEVFAPACMASFEGMPVTDDHPAFPEGVTAENIRYLQKGHAHNIRRGMGKEADLLLADLIITDPALVEEILGGKREISCGYNYALCIENGRYVQREIRGNHIAVVDAGRAGPRVSIRDHAAGKADLAPAQTYRTQDERSTNQMKRNAETVLKRKNRRESYAKRTARLMAMMARDGEAEELAEMIAEIVDPEPETAPETAAGETAEALVETVEEVLESGEAAEPEAEPVAVEVPENREITIDCGEQILSLLQQIVALMQGAAAAGPETDCGGPAPTRDEEPADPVAEALAEAVLEEISPAEPMETLVAEVIEEALEEDPAAAVGEAVEAVLAGVEADPLENAARADADPEAGLIEAEEAAENARTADALRAAMATFRPILKTMAPAARRQAVRKIADSLKTRSRASDRKAVGYGPKGAELNAYGLLKGASRRSPAASDADLGRRIMEQRNANLRKRA